MAANATPTDAPAVIAFGGFELPGVADDGVHRPRKARRRSATSVAHPGAYTAGTLPDVRIVSISGVVVGATRTDINNAWDALNGALAEGLPRKLSGITPGRHYWAEFDGLDTSRDDGWGAIEYSADFFLADPFEYEDAEQSVDVLGGSPVACFAGGTAPAAPLLSLSVSAAPGGGQITATNATTGQVFVLKPTTTGVHTIDARTGRIRREMSPPGGITVPATGRGSGQLLRLDPGSNAITVATSGGTTITAATLSWHNRWRT